MNNQTVCKVEVVTTDDDESGPAKKFCDHSVSGKFLTNLKDHLKKHHPVEYEEVRQNEEKARKQQNLRLRLAQLKPLAPRSS